RRRHTRFSRDWSSDVCSSDLAIPGRIHDSKSDGCNRLIKSNKAALLESAKDLEYIMGWTKAEKAKPIQTKIFIDLKPDEEKLMRSEERRVGKECGCRWSTRQQ